mmetsp:Transcript_63664/g.182862  ORF Transcript_63664/g.182862 Transcript_63664/m.182862 type:complete len:201 (-) Transcript_63664:1121-1723(-)
MFASSSREVPIKFALPSDLAAASASLASRKAASDSLAAKSALTAVCRAFTCPGASPICLYNFADFRANAAASSAPSGFARCAPARHSKAAASPLWSHNSRHNACDSWARFTALEESPLAACARETVRRMAASLRMSPSSLYNANALSAACKDLSTLSDDNIAAVRTSYELAIHFLSPNSVEVPKAFSADLWPSFARPCSS